MENEIYGYFLRLSSDEFFKQVLNIKKYYSGISRHWGRGTKILFLKNTPNGDAFVAFGTIEKVEHLWELSPEEEAYMHENNWKRCLTFSQLDAFEIPLRVKDSPFAGDKRKGGFLHGVKVSLGTISDIIDLAEIQAEKAGES